ncbi:hypothetical protein EAF04_004604 [Stromatinia cepivora]|nr:hypothetical protein EAF04_004604 [Stromatinia cepivora]
MFKDHFINIILPVLDLVIRTTKGVGELTVHVRQRVLDGVGMEIFATCLSFRYDAYSIHYCTSKQANSEDIIIRKREAEMLLQEARWQCQHLEGSGSDKRARKEYHLHISVASIRRM